MSYPPVSSLSVSTIEDQLAPITLPSTAPRAKFENWAKTFSCLPLVVFCPQSENDIKLIVEYARRKKVSVRCAGAGHSPSDLACTRGFLVRTDALDKVLEVNTEKQTITVQSGALLKDIHVVLAQHDLAMSNLGSISDQSIGGAITTATHGSGHLFPVISAQVLEMTIIQADASVAICSREVNPDLFWASLCSLGATGLITSLKLQVERAFRLKEVTVPMEFDECVDNLDEIAESSEHTRIWWYPQVNMMSVGRANRTYEPAAPSGSWIRGVLFGFHFIQFLLFISRYFQSLTPWVGRLVWKYVNGIARTAVDNSYTVFNFDCLFAQYTSEWAVPSEDGAACLRELKAWLDKEALDSKGVKPHFPIEIRFTSEDNIWLSPSYGRKTTYIGIVQFRPYGLPVPYRRYFSHFASIMEKHSGRPHWAKAHSLGPEQLKQQYPRFDNFVSLVQNIDPQGIFRNEYTRRHLLGEKTEDVDGIFQPQARTRAQVNFFSSPEDRNATYQPGEYTITEHEKKGFRGKYSGGSTGSDDGDFAALLAQVQDQVAKSQKKKKKEFLQQADAFLKVSENRTRSVCDHLEKNVAQSYTTLLEKLQEEYLSVDNTLSEFKGAITQCTERLEKVTEDNRAGTDHLNYQQKNDLEEMDELNAAMNRLAGSVGKILERASRKYIQTAEW